MPYIGASNNSNYSFRSLKEKHSIKESSNAKLNSDNKNNEDDDNSDLEKENTSSISSSLSNSSLATPTKDYRPLIPSVISQNDSMNMNNLQTFNIKTTSNNNNNNTNISSQNKDMRTQSIDSITSSITDVDVQELFTLPNESTHSYSYNPLSPNSLAVRLSILKRSLEIIIGNPTMMGTEPTIESPLPQQPLQQQQQQLLRGPNGGRRSYGQLRSYVSSSSMSNAAVRRRFSVATEDPLSHYQQRKWTSPTAALNAFVANPAISSNQPQIPQEGALKHRTNSLAILPKLWNDYEFDYGNNAPRAERPIKSGKRRTQSNSVSPHRTSDGIKNNQMRKISNHDVINNVIATSSSSTTTQSTPTRSNSDANSMDDELRSEADDDYSLMEEQRSNLISLLDLLNETLENNTSEKASDLHMLSLYNINKLILDEDRENTQSPINSTSNTNLNNISDENKHTKKLKKILLDSLAEPFFERNVSIEESLLEDEISLQRGLDDFVAARNENGNTTAMNTAINSAKPQQDYGRILHTFTSAKNSAPQAIFTCTQQHPWQFKAANDLACLIFGISKNVLKALTLLDLIHTDSRNFVIHKLLSTEDQELVFTGEIIGIVQPGASNNGLIWASFWAKRKNGLLVCVFEKVPCDYVDVMLDIKTFEVESVMNKSNLLRDSAAMSDNDEELNEPLSPRIGDKLITTPIIGKHLPPQFQLGNGSPSSSADTSAFNTDSEYENNETTQIDNQDGLFVNKSKNKKTVKFANRYQNMKFISNSLAKLIDDVKSGIVYDSADSSLSMAERICNHINSSRYFTLNQSTSNIPCAVSCSILENQLKLKIHSLPYQAGLFVIDSHTLQLISFNKSISKNMFGHHLFELIDKSITEIIPSFKNIMDFIGKAHPDLVITSPKNRGMVLTEHFFRKMQAEMEGTPKSFYSSTGIYGLHVDGSRIKVDFQLRVLNSSYAFVWITHSRDVAFDDYIANPSQLKMLKENELAYMSSSGSSVTSSKKSSIKASVSELKDGLNKISLTDPQSETAESVSTDADSKIPYRVQNMSTTSTASSFDEAGPHRTPIPSIPTEVEIKNRLSKLYPTDKSQFVKDGNFKVDKTSIISQISATPTPASELDPISSQLGETSSSSQDKTVDNVVGSRSRGASLVGEFPSTTFLRRPVKNIGALKHSIKFSDFIILQKMGEGAYGKVNLCMHKMEKYIVVIKMIFKERILVDTWVRDRKLGTIPSEIQIMATLNKQPHANILALLDFFEDDDYYYIETPVHGETGCIDLFDLIELKTNMTEYEAKLIFKQVVSGIKHLHDQGIVHRDIKDENVIVDSKGFVKLIDFGSAAYVKSGPFDVFVGTIDYAAPEVLSGDPYEGKPQDIWAIGILLYTIVFKENPFYNIDEILEGDLKFNSDSNEISQDCIDLVVKILNRKVRDRPNIEDIFNDKWLVI